MPHTLSSQQRRSLQLTIKANDDAYIVNPEENSYIVEAPGVLINDIPGGTTNEPYVKFFEQQGNFQGSVMVDGNGRVEYTLPNDKKFAGTEQFTYTACVDEQLQGTSGGVIFDSSGGNRKLFLQTECDTATATITVPGDPNKPNSNPIAIDDFYEAIEGQTLEVAAPGFLRNDQVGDSSNPLVRCEEGGNMWLGELDTNSDGSFEYTVERCVAGTESFIYKACYRDYPDMESEFATVTIQVVQDPNRPSPPGVQPDTYTVFDGERLEVSSSEGLLWNDAGGDTLYVTDAINRQSGFVGNLDVRRSGGFTYTPEPGRLGSYQFTYEVCFDDWECVDCRTTTATINVVTNPAKPENPPKAFEDSFEVVLGDVLDVTAPGVLDNDVSDSRYTLRVTNYDDEVIVGTFNGESNGSFEYGNAPAGVQTISYTVCYEEWPDLCADGQIKLTTKSQVPVNSDTTSRTGTATFYEINWAGRPETECDIVEPSLTLKCNGNGILNLLDIGVSDNSICTKAAKEEIATCSAKRSGILFAECRGGRRGENGDDPSDRELIVEMSSQPVDCDESAKVPIFWTYHAMWLRSWCNNEWANDEVNCTGNLLEEDGGPYICYEEHATLGEDSQPENVTMRATSYEACVFGLGNASLADLPQPAVIFQAGNDGNPSSAFPLSFCQGDCDNDDDCEGSLVCQQRSGNEVVPGCVGTPERGRDYCVEPKQERLDNTLGGATLDVVGNNREPSSVFPLAQCEGDCDSDEDCAGDLICFQRDADNDVVPGCVGTPGGESDYCIKQSSSIAASSTRADKTVVLFPRLSTVGKDGSPTSAYPLRECQGSCRTDADCSSDLVCLERSAGSIFVPGCAGATEGDTNYCIEPSAAIINTRKRAAPDLFN